MFVRASDWQTLIPLLLIPMRRGAVWLETPLRERHGHGTRSNGEIDLVLVQGRYLVGAGWNIEGEVIGLGDDT